MESLQVTPQFNNPYLHQPCDRCGSKRRVTRKWKEKLPTFGGNLTVVEYTQIDCTNKSCQIAFDKVLMEESRKREVARKDKEIKLRDNKAAKLKAKKAALKKKFPAKIAKKKKK